MNQRARVEVGAEQATCRASASGKVHETQPVMVQSEEHRDREEALACIPVTDVWFVFIDSLKMHPGNCLAERRMAQTTWGRLKPTSSSTYRDST